MTDYWWPYSLSWHHLRHAVCRDTKYTSKFVTTKSRENQTTFRKIFPLPHCTPQTKRTVLKLNPHLCSYMNATLIISQTATVACHTVMYKHLTYHFGWNPHKHCVTWHPCNSFTNIYFRIWWRFGNDDVTFLDALKPWSYTFCHEYITWVNCWFHRGACTL